MLVGVDAGADALIAAGHRPDIVVVGEEGLAQGSQAGDRGATVSDKALRTSREVVLHADRSGRALGGDRLDRLGVRHQTLSASGTSEDVALLLADVRGASLIIAVGTHATLDEFLDRQRSGLASTFLTRLRVGPKLVDAKGIPQLYAGRVRAVAPGARAPRRAPRPGRRDRRDPGGRRLVVVDRRRAVRRTRLDPRTLHVISFRYHIVSIVSVFLALAIGVALGGGPLKGEVDNTLVDQVKTDRQAKADLEAQITGLRSSNTFTDEFATTVAPGLIGDTLQGRAVTLVVLPTAQQSDVTALKDLVGVAGGTVGGTDADRQPAGRRRGQAARRRARQPARGPGHRRHHPGGRQPLRADRRPDRAGDRHRLQRRQGGRRAGDQHPGRPRAPPA